MDMIKMFNQIEDYHKTLGYHYKNMSPKECLDNIRHTGLALYQEVGELIDSFPWKPWRKVEDQTTDEYNAAIEIVDILFFLGAIMAAASISPNTIEVLFDQKLRENYDRIKRGYNNTPEDRNDNNIGNCPKCQNKLTDATGGGIKCTNPDCDYWFCF